MKRCTRCGAEKPLDEFAADIRTRDKLSYRCTACHVPIPERRGRPTVCQSCGASFMSRRAGSPMKYCSKRCYGDSLIKPVQARFCGYCGETFAPDRGALTTRGHTGQWCSTTCANRSRGMTLEERVRLHVDRGKPDGCWPWVGDHDKKGYGILSLAEGKRRGRQAIAHRVVWQLAHGEIPVGLVVCHRCDNPSCCRLEHLFLGTVAQNNADKVAKCRHVWGERHPRAKLTDAEVLSIRSRLACGEGCATLAAEHHVSHACIWFIQQGKSWRHSL
jgi:hypothetical protein